MVAAGSSVHRVPLAFDPAVVVWVPEAATTSTDHSRTTLSATVSRQDAVFNLGRVAMFVAACAVGDVAALRTATEDRLHQAVRLGSRARVRLPQCRPASRPVRGPRGCRGAARRWRCSASRSRADEVAGALPADGHVKLLRIDHEGAIVTDVAAVGEAIGATDGTAEPADDTDVADATGR